MNKYTVDSVEKEFGSSSYFSIRATSTGESMYSTTTDTKTAVANSLAADPMSFSTQMGKTNSDVHSEVAYTSDAITITHIKEQNTNNGFTRFAPGVRAEDGSITSYVGKFLFSMDVTLSSDVYVQRLGAMIADNTLNVVKGDGISQSLLLGKGEAAKFAEANPNRTFEAGVKYRIIYQMETTDATQIDQIFSCSAPPTIKIENIHVLPVEGAAGVVSSTLLFAGKSDMVTNEKDYVPEPEPEPDPEPEPNPSAKSYKLYNGKDFFKYDDWTLNAQDDKTAQTSAIINSDGNLEFTNATPSRIHLFHVATLSTGSFTHFGENGTKFTDEDPFTYFNTDITNTIDKKVNGSFDMLVLGAGKANSKTTGQAGLYFTFGSDGSITLTRQAAKADARAVDAFTVSNAFVQDTQFSLSIKLNRVDKSTLKFALEINGSPVAFTGETVTTSALSLSVDENGVFTDANWLASNGMGQRFGMLPEADSTVTISSLSITPELTPVETA